MAVSEGRKGKVTICPTSGDGALQTIAEMGEWTISGMTRNMLEYASFGDTVVNKRPGTLNPGTFSFNGYYDASDSTGQAQLITLLSSGTIIGCSSGGSNWGLKFWANDDTTLSGYGYFHILPSAAGAGMYITGLELGTNKDGLCSITFNGEITGAVVTFSTSS